MDCHRKNTTGYISTALAAQSSINRYLHASPRSSRCSPQRSVVRSDSNRSVKFHGSKVSGFFSGDAFGKRAFRLSAQARSPAENFLIVSQAVDAPVAEEKFEFQAEVSRLMDIIVHSLYSNREIFLREAISNASDALDKIRLLATTESDLLQEGEELKIQIKTDKEKKQLIIQDNGVGMTRQELIDNLGTIARSGTSRFVETLSAGQSAENLIGRFGVGFYSLYLVSDKVTVISKSPKEQTAHVWESAADNTFTLREPVEGEDVPERGTKIVLDLKSDAEEFIEDTKLRSIIKRYSEFINFPIELWSFKEVDVPLSEEELKEQDEAEGVEKKKTKTRTKTEWYWDLLNENKPIWTRNPKEVKDEEYKEFFTTVFKEYIEPIAWSHFSAEGNVEFKSILYLPERPGFEQTDWMSKSKNMKLYVKRVFIADEFEDLMPRYLNFIRGIVDSEDLPLNVSREILQQSKTLRTIQKRLVAKVIDLMKSVRDREDPKSWQTFYEGFGRNLKLGVIEDAEHKKDLLELLQFYSTKSGDGQTTLSDYVKRMKENQKSIYYIAGENLESVKSAPFLEKLIKKDLEVIFFTEAIDELMGNAAGEYKGLMFVNVSRENLSLEGEDDTEEKKKTEEAQDKLKDTIKWMEDALNGKVSKVIVSNRIESSPAVLVTGQFGWSANMERIMRAQTLQDPTKFNFMTGSKILELNPNHPLVAELDERVRYQPRNTETKELAELIYETALLTSGFSLENKVDYANRVYRMLELGFRGKVTSSSAGANGSASNGSPTESAPVEEEEEIQKVTAEVVENDD
mmetsp:Transcript_3084/g.4713  ORF Transcript_3084/g.4713 Transcript_3084/m.4713 type:complete len:801 (+) Transcript_3084:115-2517(+)